MQRRVITCYLIGQLQGATIVALRTCGESSWGMTRVNRTEYVDLMSVSDQTYEGAKNRLAEQYARLMPQLSKLLPFPQDPSRPTHLHVTRLR